MTVTKEEIKSSRPSVKVRLDYEPWKVKTLLSLFSKNFEANPASHYCYGALSEQDLTILEKTLNMRAGALRRNLNLEPDT